MSCRPVRRPAQAGLNQKDVVLLAASVYLLKQDVLRSSVVANHVREVSAGSFPQ
jgi:hypothetical protein